MTVYQWMCVLGIPSLLAGLVTFIKLQVHQNRAMKLAVKAMLQDRLLQGYKHYLEKGWADLDDRKNLENVWVQYHALGGNAVFQHLPPDGAALREALFRLHRARYQHDG